MNKLYKIIGLMSGTSCDGIDAAFIETDGESQIKLGGTHFLPYSKEFSEELVKLTKNNAHNLSQIESELTNLHAQAFTELLRKIKMGNNEIDYIGFHGHTIAHNPNAGITKQIGNIQQLAKLTGIKTVGDMRSNDVKNGGQGAPLVPIFLKGLTTSSNRTYLNIGGVSNLAYIADHELIAFDCGPGNALINEIASEFYNLEYDQNGEIARLGKADATMCSKWLGHDYFRRPYPKSLDRNTFLVFIDDVHELKKEDKIATLTELSALSIAKSIELLPIKPYEIVVYGGGRKNSFMMKRISQLSGLKITPIDSIGFDGDFIESYAFGYLAARSIKGLPITFPNTTGVKAPLSGGKLVNY